ncbi:exodeoxyribonuclease VII small subunit [Synechococcus sp. RSCCF101]|uniref:exodeoxyribonuclease VII small subunit n=1 Tax=Synechococcus sp. RSCCF101 TaxID=2511069 RepID=UPI001248914A|nr:exodeoxyribonuclease VII small subunit [Synechococcus sp. RSCCF101]QEY32939.1 exodeoxyribonuclease VII small subunit [Synechococcus sp. RSCCF101]
MARKRPAEKREPDPATSAEGLRYAECRTALELTLTALQSEDLEVEDMAALHRQATIYADHCEAILQSVEQEILTLDAEDAQDAEAPEHPEAPDDRDAGRDASSGS